MPWYRQDISLDATFCMLQADARLACDLALLGTGRQPWLGLDPAAAVPAQSVMLWMPRGPSQAKLLLKI